MATILAHFTSIQFLHPPVSGFSLLCTFILIYTLLLPCSLSCNDNTKCGITEIHYPFGLRHTGCGLPQFQIDCVNGVRPVIKIGDQNYTVIHISYDNTTSMIVQDKYFKECSFSDTLFDLKSDSSVFDSIQQLSFPLTVRLCPDQLSCVLDGAVLSLPCTLHQVIVNGGLAHWNITANPLFQKCSSCKLSGGHCGYDISKPENFLCVCENESYPDQCSTGKKKSSKSSSLAPIIGGVSGGLALLLIGGFLICRIPKQKRTGLSDRSPSPTLIAKEDKYSESRDIEAGVQQKIGNLTIFSYEILQYATDNFSEEKILGDGGFGSVYLGKLPDGRAVAVKRMYQDNSRRHDQFLNEVQILSALHHPNLVRLYGCTSPEGRDLLLVYEYVKNGTVADHLHGEKKGEGLNWKTRLKISVETAHALAFLHKQEPPVLHRDVKTTNILVDEHFMVKVADFGLSRFMPPNVTHVSTAPQGTPGYLDPEYYECFQLTERSDVYSFGVVLVELISSKLAVDVNRSRKEISLANMALTKIREGAFQELVDSNLGFDLDNEVKSSITTVAELAFRCLQSSKDDRPDMKEVVAQLDQIKHNWVHVKSAEFRSSFGSDGGKKGLSGLGPPSPTSVQDKWSSTKTTPNNSA